MKRVILCLGSNIEPRMEYLDRAQAEIAAFPQTLIVAVSPTDETDPVGVPCEYADLKFLNRIVIAETELTPEDFSRRMHAVEDCLGRVRGEIRNAPRTIDIDMIDYEGEVRTTPELTLPHPRAKERDFVMKPLSLLLNGKTKGLYD